MPVDSLALPSVLAQLRSDLENESTDALKKLLSDLLGLTADNLLRLAVVVNILEERGEDMSALKGGFLDILRKIASGQLLPDLVVLFAGEPAKIVRASKMPIPEQRKILNGKTTIPDKKPNQHRPNIYEPRPIANIIEHGTPREIGERAAGMVVACKRPSDAVIFLLAELRKHDLV